jgi:DNA mismatch repair ATPase MutS
LQTLAQLGFFVPAQKYRAPFFEKIEVIYDLEKNKGLSSFGNEVYRLKNIFQTWKSPTLLLVDEFARTTNIQEAAAFLSALIQTTFLHGNYGFFSTHFLSLRCDEEKVHFFRMKGLKQELWEKHKKSFLSLEESLQEIHHFMDYSVVKEKTLQSAYDATKVAYLLGLNPEFLKLVEQYMEESPCQN